MDYLERNPISGAMWREISCFKDLGLQWRLFWIIISTATFRTYVFTFDLIVTLILAWNSITKREIIRGGPYSFPNMILRLSIAIVALSLEIHVLINYSEFSKGISPESSEVILGLLINSIAFSAIRYFWNLFLLFGMCYQQTLFILDSQKLSKRWLTWLNELHSVTSHRFSLSFGYIVNEDRINRAIFIASEPLDGEIESLIKYGLSMCGGLTWMAHVTGISVFQPMVALGWLWIMHRKDKSFYTIRSGFRQTVRMMADIVGIMMANSIRLCLGTNITGRLSIFLAFLALYMETRLLYNTLHAIPYIPTYVTSGLCEMFHRAKDLIRWIIDSVPRIDDMNKIRKSLDHHPMRFTKSQSYILKPATRH